MALRQNYYAESVAASSTSSSTYQNKVTLTFTPDDNSDYYLLWSCILSVAGALDEALQARLFHSTASVELGLQHCQAKDLNDRLGGGGIAKVSFGAAPGSQSFTLDYRAKLATRTVTIREARIIAIKASANDKYAEDLTETIANQAAGVQTKASLTFTPGTLGDYLVLCSYEIGQNLGDDVGAQAWMEHSAVQYGFTDFLVASEYDEVIGEYNAVANMVQLNLAASSQQFDIKAQTTTAARDLVIRRTRILALRCSDFTDVDYSEARADSDTTSITLGDAITPIAITPPARNHLLIACGIVAMSTTSESWEMQLVDGASVLVTLSESEGRANNVLFDAPPAWFQILRYTPAATLKDWTIERRVEGGTGRFSQVALAVIDLGASNISVSVPTGTLDLTGGVPKANLKVPVGSGSLSLSGIVPQLRTLIPVGSGALPLTGGTPGIALGPLSIQVPAGSLTLTGIVPLLGLRIPVEAGTLLLAGNLPPLDFKFNIPSGNLTLTGIAVQLHEVIPIPPGEINLTGEVPDVGLGPFTILVPAGELFLEGGVPIFTGNYGQPTGSIEIDQVGGVQLFIDLLGSAQTFTPKAGSGQVFHDIGKEDLKG